MSAAATTSPQADVARWATSGAMALTGRSGGRPLGPPEPLVGRLEAIARRFGADSDRLGNRTGLDPLAMLTWRAAITELSRHGDRSCGGATRLLPTGDDWIAVSLPRRDDIELVPAWLEIPAQERGDPWSDVTREVRHRHGADLVDRAGLLGLAVAALGERTPMPGGRTGPFEGLPVRAEALGSGSPVGNLSAIRVLDLSSLWAGPWCGTLLARAGADVVKIESFGRPDGARLGPAPFFDTVNTGKRSVALDLDREVGRRRLRSLVECADVVIEGSRPRALEQMGIDARRLLATESGRLRVWISVTGHGRSGEAAQRIGFGDDAAVAGGLVAHDERGPCFCVDAIADPCAGLVAATATLAALRQGDRWLVDISLAGVAAHLAGPTLVVPDGVTARAPARHRAPIRRRPSAPTPTRCSPSTASARDRPRSPDRPGSTSVLVSPAWSRQGRRCGAMRRT